LREVRAICLRAALHARLTTQDMLTRSLRASSRISRSTAAGKYRLSLRPALTFATSHPRRRRGARRGHGKRHRAGSRSTRSRCASGVDVGFVRSERKTQLRAAMCKREPRQMDRASAVAIPIGSSLRGRTPR
jgi:hypothetical protein